MDKIKIIFTIILFSFLFVSCWKNIEKDTKKEVLNNNTQEQTKTNSWIMKKNKENFKLHKFNKDITKISFIDLNNSLYSNWWWDNLKKKIKLLSASWETINNKMKATFLESFIWDYKNALSKRNNLCKNNESSQFCKKVDLNLISYRPVDKDWNIVKNVQISIDWKQIWNLKWKNNLKVENKFIHRIRISKEWYLDFYKKIFIDASWNEKESLNPKLLKASLIKVIDSTKDNQLKTNNFSYDIKSDSFITKDWKKYSWKVKLYAFDIWENNWDLNVLNLDAFDNNGSYVWNSMVTFGMPLIIAYDNSWNRLKISGSILWKWKIENIDKAPWIDLVNVPKNTWLSKKELDKYKIPPFWHLDLDSWVWNSDEMKILDINGNYEFRLY